LKKVIGTLFERADDISKESKAFWEKKLRSGDRVEKQPHVTVTHQNNLSGESELWDQCVLLQQTDPSPRSRMKLGSVVWNDRAMAISVYLEDADQTEVTQGLSIDYDLALLNGRTFSFRLESLSFYSYDTRLQIFIVSQV
jgi:Fungal tRNA ligase phosphodiesterase domain